MIAGRTSDTKNFAITRISITLALCSFFEQPFFLFLPSSSEVGAQRAFLFTTACLKAMEILNVNPKRSKHGTSVTNSIAKIIWYTVQYVWSSTMLVLVTMGIHSPSSQSYTVATSKNLGTLKKTARMETAIMSLFTRDLFPMARCFKGWQRARYLSIVKVIMIHTVPVWVVLAKA